MEAVRVLRDDLVLVDWGPMTLTIAAWAGGQPRPVMAAQAARVALRGLADLARFQNYLRLPAADLPSDKPLPDVVSRALAAARAVGRGLTPLAAVAGAAADLVAEAAASLGADKVVVNNGGDIALRLAPGQAARVGVRLPGRDEASPGLTLGRLTVRGGEGIGGVATSGWSGRSQSQGVADLVSVWARDAALADAAATALGNAVAVEAGAVERRPAREVEPFSDLGDTMVTTAVGELSPEERRAALAAGQGEALAMREEGLIAGCLLVVQGESALLDSGQGLALADGGLRPGRDGSTSLP